MNNKMFAEKDMYFQKACQAAGVEITKRQASKFRNKKGSAYLLGRSILEQKSIMEQKTKMEENDYV